MAGRREHGGGSIVDGFQTGDYSIGKSIVKDQSRKKDWSKRSVTTVTSTPIRKLKNNSHHRLNNNGRHCSNQRYNEKQEVAMDDLEYVEKDLLTKERKKSSHLSLSHLLNFTVTPRDRHFSGNHYGGGGGSGYKHFRKQNSYNKEQFLQANCQFMVKEGGDYSVNITQSDLLVDWNNIEQVRLFCHDIPSCPVCLHLPTAAKITRCGHVFCSSCILHYLALSDKKWRKCPICYESIYKHDLKSVTTFASKKYEVNDVISMTLMKRKKGTTIVMPSADWDDSDMKIQQFNDDQNCQFSKLVLATSSQILTSVVQPEQLALQKQLSSLTPDEESERCFIESALEDSRLRIEKLVKNEHVDNSEPIEDTSKGKIDVSTTGDNSDESITNSEATVSIHDFERSSTDSENGSPKSLTCISPRNEYVYFYQANDGQHLYIHPLNGKALVTEYGDWDKCPKTITARIVEIEQHTMTENEKIRSKYLNHLPLTCEFALCEVELGHPILSPKIIDMFYEQFQKRKQRRQRKKREEKRQEKKQVKNQSGIYFSSDTANITPEHFHDFLSIASSPPLPSHISSHYNPVQSPTQWKIDTCDSSEISAITQPSFAQALAKGDTKSTHKPMVPPTSSDLSGSEYLQTVDDDFHDQAVPSFQNSFSNALLTSTNKVLVSNENRGGKPGGSKAAKKGRKKIVLFSTAGGNHRV